MNNKAFLILASHALHDQIKFGQAMNVRNEYLHILYAEVTRHLNNNRVVILN